MSRPMKILADRPQPGQKGDPDQLIERRPGGRPTRRGRQQLSPRQCGDKQGRHGTQAVEVWAAPHGLYDGPNRNGEQEESGHELSAR
jgi:hypothetical protein